MNDPSNIKTQKKEYPRYEKNRIVTWASGWLALLSATVFAPTLFESGRADAEDKNWAGMPQVEIGTFSLGGRATFGIKTMGRTAGLEARKFDFIRLITWLSKGPPTIVARNSTEGSRPIRILCKLPY
jgi:hypothetical protein